MMKGLLLKRKRLRRKMRRNRVEGVNREGREKKENS